MGTADKRPRVSLADFQRRLITTLLDIDELWGFALAGGWALNSHHVLERPTRGIDLFTPDPGLVPVTHQGASPGLPRPTHRRQWLGRR